MQQSLDKTYFKIDNETLDLIMSTLANAAYKDVAHIFQAVKWNVTPLQDSETKD